MGIAGATGNITNFTWRAPLGRAMRLHRLPDNPIIRSDMDPRMGDNINGPSLIRAPEWLENPLGRYYLYFAHHKGTYIRLAYADRPEGPYTTYEPGALELADSFAADHIASPDVHVDDERREIVMYYHGRRSVDTPGQETRVALSPDGIKFTAQPEVLGAPYFRAFQHAGLHYAIGMPGILYRSEDGRSGFERGPQILPDNTRHVAVLLHDESLTLFYTMVGETPPERVLVGEIDLSVGWTEWSVEQSRELLLPEHDWEGADQPPVPSARGIIEPPVNQLRDPGIFEDGDVTYLLYAVAGERGIAIARLETQGAPTAPQQTPARPS